VNETKFLLVASDVHDNESCFEKLAQIARDSSCVAFLYAGDLNVENYFICEALRQRNFTFIPVLGNCDNPWAWIDAGVPQPTQFKTLQYANSTGKLSIYMSHGHRYPYPSSVGLADEDYDIYITGHTHAGLIKTTIIETTHIYSKDSYSKNSCNNNKNSNNKEILLFNPGSPASPRGGKSPSYGIIRIPNEGSVTVELRNFINNSLLSNATIALH